VPPKERPVGRRVAFVATLLVLALTAGGCIPSISRHESKPAPAGADAITWNSCGAEALKLNPNLPRGLTVQCGTLAVPQDWRTAKDGKDPDGKTFDLALMRIRSDKQHNRIGSILTNPGGPGGSGVEFLPFLAGEVAPLLERFDLIGFDPRGVGRSKPAVECISDADLDATFGYEPDPVSDQSFQGIVALNRKIAEGCQAQMSSQLELFSTEQAAKDMDALRASLGDEKLTYLGFSYGTLLGAVYAELFPTHIRAMVLDGAVDPQESFQDSSEGQALGFERAFTNFTAWCAQTPSKCPIAPDARAAVNTALHNAAVNPVKGSDGRSATPGWVFYAVIRALYRKEYWPIMAQAIADLNKGNARYTFLLADDYASRDENGHYDNLFDANVAINCIDTDKYPTVEDVRGLQSQWRAKYPLFGGPMAAGLITCSVWPAKKDPYPVGPAKGAPPIVVVGTKGDPATPYESAQKLADMLGTGTVVTYEGEGHTAYPDTNCIRKAVDDYLINLKVPDKGISCPA
jgi:pimeloyl-ACP methyl ester carboxylesterase